MSQPINISFTRPLGNAWHRMKFLLFRPFDLGRWFVLGFTAFLADLGSGSNGGNSAIRFSDKLDRGHGEEWSSAASGFFEKITDNAWLVLLVGFLLLVGLVLGVLFLWLSSRGRFMFLDNIASGRTEVKRPWNEYSAEGDSLFKWQIVFALICLLVFGLYTVALVFLFVPLKAMGLGGAAAIPLVFFAGTLGFCLISATVYIEFFLHSFVVTIMYRERISATEGWSLFSQLFSQHPGTLTAYGLFYLVVAMAGVAALLLGGALTCCLGLLLLMLPYIGSVVSLPLSVTMRYLDLEFLAQFGPEYQVLGALPCEPDLRSIYRDADGTVVGPEDFGENPGDGEPGSEHS